MYRRSAQIWYQYPPDIVAVNNQEALYLLYFQTIARIYKIHLNATEIIDLQRYRVVCEQIQISTLLALPPEQQIFLFPVNKN